MYRQTTYAPNKVYSREINDQETIKLLVQLHLLKQGGEDINVSTNAAPSNGWSWDTIRVERRHEDRTVTTIFQHIEE